MKRPRPIKPIKKEIVHRAHWRVRLTFVRPEKRPMNYDASADMIEYEDVETPDFFQLTLLASSRHDAMERAKEELVKHKAQTGIEVRDVVVEHAELVPMCRPRKSRSKGGDFYHS